MSKIKQTWRCNVCSCKITTLYRQHGKWPTQEFMELTETVQQEFYSRIASMSAHDVMQAATTLVSQVQTRKHEFDEGGQYLPLSKWEKDGFDIEKIVAHTPACDIQDHPILGTCYRVPLLATRETGTKGTETVLNFDRRGQPEQQPRLMPAPKVAPKKKATHAFPPSPRPPSPHL